MPVRSFNSVVLKWPGREEVLSAARRWAEDLRRDDGHVEAVFCVGSYARGDWGVGSDLDVIVLVDEAEPSLAERRARYEPRGVPVPVDIWVYTRAEWTALADRAPHVVRRIERERVNLEIEPE